MMNDLTRTLPKAFLGSACQFVLFRIIFCIYILWLPWPPIWWSGLVGEFLIPFIGGCVCCWIVHRGHFHFDLRNAGSKLSVYRLAGRMLSILCFLVIGGVLEKLHHADPELPVNLLFKLGISYDQIYNELYDAFFNFLSFLSDSLFGFDIYIVTAFFPFAYAVVEFLFVSPTRE